MAINLTPTQSFQSKVNSLIFQVNNMFSDKNANGLINMYNDIYKTIFSYQGQTPAAVIAQLSTNAGNILVILSAYRKFLLDSGVTDLSVIPAYIVNPDGSATLS